MKTPMNELLEWVRETFPMDLDTPNRIEEKIKSMIEKEKKMIIDTFDYGTEMTDYFNPLNGEEYYRETFNNKEI
jgi:hypothetical protein